MCCPGHPRLRLEIALLDNRRRWRDDDEMVAAGALDLSAGKFAVALDVLIAMRAGELEFAHKMQRDRSSTDSFTRFRP